MAPALGEGPKHHLELEGVGWRRPFALGLACPQPQGLLPDGAGPAGLRGGRHHRLEAVPDLAELAAGLALGVCLHGILVGGDRFLKERLGLALGLPAALVGAESGVGEAQQRRVPVQGCRLGPEMGGERLDCLVRLLVVGVHDVGELHDELPDAHVDVAHRDVLGGDVVLVDGVGLGRGPKQGPLCSAAAPCPLGDAAPQVRQELLGTVHDRLGGAVELALGVRGLWGPLVCLLVQEAGEDVAGGLAQPDGVLLGVAGVQRGAAMCRRSLADLGHKSHRVGESVLDRLVQGVVQALARREGPLATPGGQALKGPAPAGTGPGQPQPAVAGDLALEVQPQPIVEAELGPHAVLEDGRAGPGPPQAERPGLLRRGGLDLPDRRLGLLERGGLKAAAAARGL